MEACDTSLLRSIRQAAAASDPLATTLLKRWNDQFTPEVLTQATVALGDLWNNQAAGVCDALRWSVLCGHLQSISFVGAILVPRGILLHCSATYCDFDGARVNSHFVPLAMAAGPRLFQYLHDHDNPLVTSLIFAWSPAHKAMDTLTLRSSITRMLQRDVASALSCDNKTIQKQLMKPISNFITQTSVRRPWDSVQPPDALQMLWHLPQEVSVTVPASYHGPLVDLWYDLLSWSSSAIRIGIASGVPRQPLVMNINDSSTLTASYEASTVPLSNFSRLSDLAGSSDLSWATAPSVCVLHRAPEPLMTPSQFWRRYAPGKAIEYPGHVTGFSIPVDFNVEPAEIMSTQSPHEPVEQQSNLTLVDLTMEQAAPDPTIDTLLSKFDAISTDPDEELQRLRTELQTVQSALDHLRAYSSQQEGLLTAEKTKWPETVASTKESHLNEVRALHKRIGALASDLNVAQTEVQRLRSVQRNPLDLPLLMGILRAVHAHHDLPRKPILQALTDLLPRGKYQLPSVSSPLFLWSIPLIVAIVSMSEPGSIDWKPLVRSLRPAKTVSFELPETAPPPPPKPSVDSPPTQSDPLRNSTSAHQAVAVPTSLLPTSSTPPNPPTASTSLARFLQWLNGVPPSQENEEARRFHLFLNLSCTQDAPPLDFPRDSLYAQWEFLSKHVKRNLVSISFELSCQQGNTDTNQAPGHR